MFGLGPPTDLDGFTAAGAAIGVDAVHRRGGLATIAVRVATHARDGVRLVRTRVAVAGGWAWRRRSFELLSRVGMSVEPTIARDRGRTTVATAPLVGALASLAPAFVWLSADGTSALRVGLDLEIAASMEARARPGVIRWLDASGDGVRPLLRAGGLELAVGLGVGGWFAVGRGRLRP